MLFLHVLGLLEDNLTSAQKLIIRTSKNNPGYYSELAKIVREALEELIKGVSRWSFVPAGFALPVTSNRNFICITTIIGPRRRSRS